jgi:hypothetical protein
MKATFENTLHLTEQAIGLPFMIEETIIGNITEVNEDYYCVEIWDRYIGMELKDKKPFGVYLSTKEQHTYSEFMELVSKK